MEQFRDYHIWNVCTVDDLEAQDVLEGFVVGIGVESSKFEAFVVIVR